MTERSRQPVGLVFAVVVVLALGAYVAFRLGARPNAGAAQRQGPGSATFDMSISNAKELAVANAMYASDWDDTLPLAMEDPADWQRAVMPYLLNTSVFFSGNPAGSRFLGNERLSAVPLPELTGPDRAVLLYESKEWPDGRRIIGYADAHVKALSGFDLATGLYVEVTPEGRRAADRARGWLRSPRRDADQKNPLGMPGD